MLFAAPVVSGPWQQHPRPRSTIRAVRAKRRSLEPLSSLAAARGRGPLAFRARGGSSLAFPGWVGRLVPVRHAVALCSPGKCIYYASVWSGRLGLWRSPCLCSLHMAMREAGGVRCTRREPSRVGRRVMPSPAGAQLTGMCTVHASPCRQW